MVGTALVEDLAVVVLTVLVPVLGTAAGERLLAFGWGFAKAAAILLPFGYLAFKVVSPLLARVARTHNQELFLLVALAIGLGAAAVTQAVGLSLALGPSWRACSSASRTTPTRRWRACCSLRDAFVALFFVTVGALIDPLSVVSNLPLLGAIVGLVVIGKLDRADPGGLAVRAPFWTALRAAWDSPRSASSRSFSCRWPGRPARGRDVYNAVLAASLLTILVNALS